jgi:hypothetical protein
VLCGAILRKTDRSARRRTAIRKAGRVPPLLLLHSFARRATPLTFSDLAGALAGTGVLVSGLAAALAAALEQQTVVPCGFAPGAGGTTLGPRLLTLSARGRAAVAADRS